MYLAAQVLPQVAAAKSSTMDDNADAMDRLKELESGIEQFVRIHRKSMLYHAMEVLGAPEPELSVVLCADDCVKVRIKLHLSSVISNRGERINFSVFEGETSINHINAEATAIDKALKHLEINHMVQFFDFSSRVISVLERSNIRVILADGIGAIENLLGHWDKISVKFNEFLADLQRNKLYDYFGGQLSPIGTVYAVLNDYLSSIHSDLDAKAIDISSDFADLKSDRLELEHKLQQRSEAQQTGGRYHGVELSSKYLLELVLSFYALHDAEYISSPHPHGLVKSRALFEFPYLKNFKYGGKLEIEGHGSDSVEAEENAAQEALLFIEKNFRTHVIDYNFSKLKKARKAENKFISMVERTIELGHSMERMYREFINEIQGQRRQFREDANNIFSGDLAAGQIQAYGFCANGLKAMDEYCSQTLADFDMNFDNLQKLIWKLAASMSKLPI